MNSALVLALQALTATNVAIDEPMPPPPQAAPTWGDGFSGVNQSRRAAFRT